MIRVIFATLLVLIVGGVGMAGIITPFVAVMLLMFLTPFIVAGILQETHKPTWKDQG